MPNKTDGEEERDDSSPQPFLEPKIDQIAKLVGPSGAIAREEEKAQKSRSELGNLYKKIENDHHGNRKAVKLVRTLLNGTQEAAHDFMRTLLRLADRFELMPGPDLVDLADRHAKILDAENDEERRITEFDGAPREEGGNETLPERETAIDRAKKHLAGGTKPPAPPAAENNQDLVDAGEAVAAEIETGLGTDVGSDLPGEASSGPVKADNVLSLAGRTKREDRSRRPAVHAPSVPTVQ